MPGLREAERAAAEWAKGKCQFKGSRGSDGSFVSDVTCKVGGIAVTTHQVRINYSPIHTRSWLETTSVTEGSSRLDKTWFDADWTYVGECPPGLLPGQHLLPNGWVLDPARLARGHLTLANSATASLMDEKAGSALTSATVPLAPERLSGSAHVVCGRSGDGTKWGSLRLDTPGFPFGSGDQTWRVRPDLGASAAGEHMLIWEVFGPRDRPLNNDEADAYDAEPHYTVRLGTYSFTPPISEQACARGPGGDPLTRRAAQAREAARAAAESRGGTYCYVSDCFPSDADKEAFVHAFDDAASAGEDLTISGVGPNGVVSLRYPLKGLGGIWRRLEQCTTI